MGLFQLVSYLTQKLKEPLPGKKAHFDMIPSIRVREFDPIPPTARISSVIILLFEKQNKVYTLLTLRTAYNGVHSSQISFPGGSYIENDISLQNTALRETQEEIGLASTKINIIGNLTDLYIPPSNFVVTPFIGYTNEIGLLSPDSKEVERIFETDIKEFIGTKNIKTKKIKTRSGIEFETPYYDIEGQTVWGATAMILKEFSDICKDFYQAT